MASNCTTCNSLVREDAKVHCDLCKGLYHVTCAGLSRQEAACLKNAVRRLQFFCKNCNIAQIMKGLKDDVVSLMSRVNVLEENLAKQISVNLSNTDVTIGSDTIDSRQAPLSHEQMYSELEDRRRRVNNIIVSNIPESASNSRDGRAADDQKAVTDIISSSGLSDVSIIKCFRLGKPTSNKVRPLCVTLPTEDTAKRVLYNYKSCGTIFINRDLTRMQQDIAYRTRKNFKERIANGEKGIQLKYRNGIPSITQTKNQ